MIDRPARRRPPAGPRRAGRAARRAPPTSRSSARRPTAPRPSTVAAELRPGRRADGPVDAGHRRRRGDPTAPSRSRPRRVVVLTSFSDRRGCARRSGRRRSATCSRTASPRTLLAAVRAAAAGHAPLDPRVARRPAAPAGPRRPPTASSAREREVLRLVAAGPGEQADRPRPRDQRADGQGAPGNVFRGSASPTARAPRSGPATTGSSDPTSNTTPVRSTACSTTVAMSA